MTHPPLRERMPLTPADEARESRHNEWRHWALQWRETAEILEKELSVMKRDHQDLRIAVTLFAVSTLALAAWVGGLIAAGC